MLNIVLIKEERVIDMTDQRIYELACIFKSAMVAARDEGLLMGIIALIIFLEDAAEILAIC